MGLGRRFLVLSTILLMVFANRQPAAASCNVIPGATRTFRAAVGYVDRPFAGPGDFIELRPNSICSPDADAFSADPADHVVSFVFRPPNGAAQVVVLAADCDAQEAKRLACGATPGVTTVTCLAANQPGQPIDVEVLELDGLRRLRVRLPDTDALLGSSDDDRTLSGPLRFAVTAATALAPLPCDLANLACGDLSGMAACVDDLFEIDGTCDSVTHSTFPQFTALPPPNSYQALCTEPSPPCTGTAHELRMTTDQAGNLLIPMDWRGILVGKGVPIARLLRGSTSAAAFPGDPSPVRIPSNDLLGSYSPEGTKLPPVFDPQSDSASHESATLFGSADAPSTVLRVARESPSGRTCSGGPRSGKPCATSFDCSDGDGPIGAATCESASSLFEFRGRYVDDAGPVVIERFGPGTCQGSGTPCAADIDCDLSRCVAYDAVAADPVPLDGLHQSDVWNAFVVGEAIDGKDLNGDGDTLDHVLLLADRSTGAVQRIGNDLALGRATTRLYEPPFSSPAVAVDHEHLAFLESEPLQHYLDINGDGDVFDAILRVYHVVAGHAVGVDLQPAMAVDVAPRIDGRSLALVDGRVFVRSREAANARQRAARVSIDSANGQLLESGRCPALSADGLKVVFAAAGGAGVGAGVLLRDRAIETTELLLDATTGIPSWSDVTVLALSADARTLAVAKSDETIQVVDLDAAAVADNVLGRWPSLSADGASMVFARDGGLYRRAGGADALVVAPEGALDIFQYPEISADGSTLGFVGSGPPSYTPNAYIHDLITGSTENITIAAGRGVDIDGYTISLSQDARFVAFDSGSLLAGDTNSYLDVFRYDRLSHTTVRASIDSAGVQANGPSLQPRLSADGRFVAFRSFASNLVPASTRVCTAATCDEIFLHDTLSQATMRVTSNAAGVGGNAGSSCPAISADGRFVAFSSTASNLVEGDTNASRDTFVFGPDLDDCGADLNGDCDLADTILQVVEVESVMVTTLCPAGDASISGAGIAFLRPESGGDAPGCPAGPDFDADGDTDDDVVHLWDPTNGVVNLGRAATALAATPTLVAALVPHGAVEFLEVYSRSGVSWVDTGIAAERMVANGNTVASLAIEAAHGTDLNGDGDTLDRVVHVYDSESGAGVVNLGQAAEDLVIGATLLAFRTREAAQGVDLNGDGDTEDDVLQVYELNSGVLVNTGQAVTPCRLEACDPQYPYRVLRDTVKFLTRESDQGTDLNADGDTSDLILQTFNARRSGPSVALSRRSSRGARITSVAESRVTVLAAAAAGVCSTTGRACAADSECGGGHCFVPPGACLRATTTPCEPPTPESADTCGDGSFCRSEGGAGSGLCHVIEGACRSAEDCVDGAWCAIGDQGYQRLVEPLVGVVGVGEVFTGSGECVEIRPFDTNCVLGSDCAAGEVCLGGSCRLTHGSCAQDVDCPASSTCLAEVRVHAADDADRDEIADPFDNCPYEPNVDQSDIDEDGVGDVCEAPVGTLTLTSTAARPGGIACVVGALQASAGRVASLRSEIGGSLTLGDPNCVPAFGFNGAMQFLATPSGEHRARVELGMSGGALASGDMFVCTVGVPSSAAVGNVFLSQQTELFAPSGNAMTRVNANAGRVPVTTCTGDCDGNATVTIGEVTRCVNAFLGAPLCDAAKPLSSCPVADANRNTEVSIGEVTQCVQRFLLGCGSEIN